MQNSAVSRLRVLVTTAYLAEFSGSEVLALDVARYFNGFGADVTIATNFVNPLVRAAIPAGIQLTDDVNGCDLRAFDLVWCQHSLVAQFSMRSLQIVCEDGELPLIALVSLSRRERLESIDLVLANVLGSPVMCNSSITQRHVRDRVTDDYRGPIVSFDNAPLDEFWSIRRQRDALASADTEPRELRHVTAISNHPPQELSDALDMLERNGIAVQRLGRGAEYKLVGPGDFAETDAVISIGRSVHFALASGVPVFVYDHFGGDGWLTSATFARDLRHNFTGRPLNQRRPASELADEILSGYDLAVREFSVIMQRTDVDELRLERWLEWLRLWSGDSAAQADRSRNAAEYLRESSIGLHLAILRAEHRAIRKSYRATRTLADGLRAAAWRRLATLPRVTLAMRRRRMLRASHRK